MLTAVQVLLFLVCIRMLLRQQVKSCANGIQFTQTAVALTNIGVQVVDGSDFTYTYTTTDSRDVRAPNISCYFTYDLDGSSYCPLDRSDPQHQATAQFVAHNFGQSGRTAAGQDNPPCHGYNENSEILNINGVVDDERWGNYVPSYFCRRSAGRQEFAYRFLEFNPIDNRSAFPAFTNRLVTVSSGNCIQYSMQSRDPNKDPGVWSYKLVAGNSTNSTTLEVAEQNEALEGTTYIYDGNRLPPDAANPERVNCGPRCIWIWAHLNSPQDGLGPDTFFKCPITVDPVMNATQDTHKLPDDMARYAAASIALSGRQREVARGRRTWQQSTFFPSG